MNCVKWLQCLWQQQILFLVQWWLWCQDWSSVLRNNGGSNTSCQTHLSLKKQTVSSLNWHCHIILHVILFASEYSSNESVKPRLYLLSNKPKYQGLKTISIYFGDSNFRNSPWIRNAEFVKEGREKMVESFHVPFTFHCSKLVTEPNLVLMGLESVCLSTFCILRNISSWKHLWTI